MNKRPPLQRAHAGSILIMVCGLILALTCIALLAFNAGRIFIVRTELQNAADAAALAGAACLVRAPLAGSEVDCSAAADTAVNWDRAEAKALDQLGKNAADNLALSTTDAGHVIQAGYWNLLHNAASGGALSTADGALEPYDAPAVMVSVMKDEGMNGGMLSMLPGALFGAGQAVRASALAVLASPGKVPAGRLAPYVINRCLADSYWDAAAGEPSLATASELNGVPQTIDQPWEIRLGPNYVYGTGEPDCTSGQWTTFGADTNDSTIVKNLIDHGNPQAIALGDHAWLEPLVDASLYDELAQRLLNTDLPLLVVHSANANVPGWAPVQAIAGFHVTAVNAGQRYVQGHFIKNHILAGASGVGPSYFGVYTPPRLAQ